MDKKVIIIVVIVICVLLICSSISSGVGGYLYSDSASKTPEDTTTNQKETKPKETKSKETKPSPSPEIQKIQDFVTNPQPKTKDDVMKNAFDAIAIAMANMKK